MLPGIVQSSTSGGALGFDTDTIVTADVAALFQAQGYAFCLRYLSIDTPQDPGDLSTAEALDILNAGLALMPVQHVPTPPWAPDAGSGERIWRECRSQRSRGGFSCRGVRVV